ncbi:uncharacterized protein LOC141632808 [Silene latifolia]|uniref:uncharacterized protein LOC141632808 n=1 Tax=Silene latifolia TaxID=37657 RepID=UPI003D77C3C7
MADADDEASADTEGPVQQGTNELEDVSSQDSLSVREEEVIIISSDDSAEVQDVVQLGRNGFVDNEAESDQQGSSGDLLFTGADRGTQQLASFASDAITRKGKELYEGSSNLIPLEKLMQEAYEDEVSQIKGRKLTRNRGLKFFDIPEVGAKAKQIATIPVGSNSDGFLGLADVYHYSDLRDTHREEICAARKRKCCTEAGDYIIPEDARKSLENAKAYLHRLAKKGRWEQGFAGGEHPQQQWGFKINVADVVMVDSSDSSNPSVNGRANDRDGFAETLGFEDCLERVRIAWSAVDSGSPAYRVARKLARVRGSVKKWTLDKKAEWQDKWDEFDRKLEQGINTACRGGDEEYTRVHEEFRIFAAAAAVYWKQRAKVKWTVEGDTCTKFFFNWVKGRAGRNLIHGLKGEDGQWRYDDELVGSEFQRHYMDLYQSSRNGGASRDTAGIESILDHVQSRVAQDEVDRLSRPFTAKEHDFTAGVLSILNSGRVLKELNRTFITLIPKTDAPEGVSDYRPISLCNVIMRVVTKCIANRLAKVMGSLVSESQNAFLPGRSISDNILLAHEAIYHITRHRKGVHGRCAFKADMSKAYDRIKWDFLEMTLVKFGFPLKLVQLIMNCVNSVLSANIDHAQDSGRLEGFKLCRGVRPMTHLFFADDAVFFFKDKGETACHLKSIIDFYCEASGQKLNSTKSGLIFSPNTTLAKAQQILKVFNVRSNRGIGKYLGIPAEFQESKKGIFQSLVDQITKRISSWNDIFLSPAGRLTLISSVLSNLSNYFLSVFKIPDGVFTVKSGYGLIFDEYMSRKGTVRDKTRIGERERAFCRKQLWTLPVPNSWKILVWRIITNTLSVGKEFHRRHLEVDVLCSLCGESHCCMETLEHLFRDCEVSARIWAGSSLGIRVDGAELVYMADWLIDWVRYLWMQDEGQIRVINFIAILWGLWTIRNKVKFDGMTKNPHVLADLLFGLTKDKIGILKDQLKGKGMTKRVEGGVEELLDQRRMDMRTGHPVQLIGCPDRCNVIRVKVDVGWERNYVAAFGWVAYDGQGQECMRRQVKTKAESALQAEALGVRDVLLWASSEGWLHMDISSDCLQLINAMARIDKVNHLITGILEDMHKLASSFHCLCFSFIPRNLNSIAHGLARQAIKL